MVIAAPCCHKYVRARLKVPNDLKPIFKHGVLEEQLAVSLSDGLRALTLESLGFKTRVFEFISPEHTSKNTMIAGIQIREPQTAVKTKISELRDRFGLSDFYLDLKLLSS